MRCELISFFDSCISTIIFFIENFKSLELMGKKAVWKIDILGRRKFNFNSAIHELISNERISNKISSII